jgi:biopolymer transport protein ExbD
MPVHVPGPRLYSSLKFKHIAAGASGGTSRPSNISLNVVPFIDIMTILVCFLLMVFSATGDILMSQRGLELPEAAQQDLLQRAPVIVISKESISFNGEDMAQLETIVADTSPQWKLPELYDRMQLERAAFEANFANQPDGEKARCARAEAGERLPAGEMCLRGLAVLQADKTVPAKVINRVLKTANAAGYTNIMFAVNLRAGRG